jgi:DNA-binding MarR family transcriptional regulator
MPAAKPDRDQAPEPVGSAGFEQLAALRHGIRTYLAWAEQEAREHDMTPAQVQLGLAIRASKDLDGPTLTALVEMLLLRHHSVVGLVDRAAAAGLVERTRDREHASMVHVTLTASGAERLETLARLHLRWLAEHGQEIGQALSAFARANH